MSRLPIIVALLLLSNVVFCQRMLNSQQYNYALTYVCKIEIENKKISQKPTTLTGFLVDEKRIITALHGLAGKLDSYDKMYIKVTFYPLNKPIKSFDNEDRNKPEISLTGLDLTHDLAVLTCNKCDNKSGLKIGKQLTADEKLHIYGYPNSNVLETQVLNLTSGSTEKLNKFIQQDAINDLGSLKYPNDTILVIKISSADIFSGYSGSPILNNKNEVVGMVDGFELDAFGVKRNGWAIPVTEIPIAVYKPGTPQYATVQATAKIKQNIKYIAYGTEVPSDSTQHQPQPIINFKHIPPKISIGSYLTKLYTLPSSGINPSGSLVLNGFADLYIDFRINKGLTLGAYASSTFIQYQVVRQWENNIQLPATSVNNQQKKLFELWGLQATWWLRRGIMTDYFVGAGIGSNTNSFLVNYRGYAGIRHYLGPQRILAFEAKALINNQVVTTLVPSPRLGNARFVSNNFNLTNIHLCIGLNFSIGKK